MGKNDVEDALKRLDTLTQEEARMATAEILKVMHSVDDKVDDVKRSSLPDSPHRYFAKLNRYHREDVATRSSKMALSTRSRDKS